MSDQAARPPGAVPETSTGTAPGVRRLGLVLALGGLLVVVDTTVTVLALPVLVAELGSTLPAVQWVSTGYLLGVVVVIPVAGWLSQRFGARRTYLAALALFTFASALVGVGWDVASVTAFRVLQGLGGGLLNPVGQAIALRAVPRGQRGRVMALLGLSVVAGPVLGPLLAGVVLDVASWRWIFWINVPLGLVAGLLCWWTLPADRGGLPARRRPATAPAPMDWAGLALVSTSAGLLVLSCSQLGQHRSHGALTFGAIGLGVALMAGFVVRELTTEHPLLDLRLLRHRPLAAGLGVLATFGAGYFGALSVLPVFVQAVRGDTALFAGQMVLPMAVGVGLAMQVATRLVDRSPPRRIVLTGATTALVGAVSLWAATFADAAYPVIAAAAVVLGLGSGATLMPTATIAVRDLREVDTPGGTTLLALVQQLANALGLAAVAALVAARLGAEGAATGRVDGYFGVAEAIGLGQGERASLAWGLAQAVGGSYMLPVCLIAGSAAMAAICLPRSRPD